MFATSALAGQAWNVNEISTAGIKTSQGVWTVNAEGGKLTGKAEMQLDNGNTLTYGLEGGVADNVYTVNLTNRSDSKKGCVWTGKNAAEPAQKSTVLMGEVVCEGSKFKVKAAF
jgi:hypothetical protein